MHEHEHIDAMQHSRSLSLTSIGVQTDCRESEVQTDPFTPQVKLTSFHPSLSENLKPSGNRSSFRRRHRLVGAELIAAWKVMNMFLTDSTITKYLRGLPVETDFDAARVRTLVKLQVVAFGQQETS